MKKLSYLVAAAALVMAFGLSGVANAQPEQPILTKDITVGPDVDNDGVIDRVIEVRQTSSTEYEYELTYVPAGGPPNVVIIDTVPAEWDVTSIDGVPNLPLDCGESETDVDGNLALKRGGKAGKKCSSATKFIWKLASTDGTQMVTVATETRESPATIKHSDKKDPKFKPTSCGKLTLNDGAQAFEANPDGTLVLDINGDPILVAASFPLMLVAVEDLNGGGIVGDGTGDEDLDGLPDAEEAFFLGTDPCLADTDGDGVNDGVDPAPLNPDVS